MWLLVRAEAVDEAPDGTARLAACPDSGERGDAWRWTVCRRRDAAGRLDVAVEAHPDHVVAVTTDEAVVEGGLVDLPRAAGEQLVVTVLAGRGHVEHTAGPWSRWLETGDVLVVEGDDAEALRLTSPAAASRVAVVRLTATGTGPLRWVP